MPLTTEKLEPVIDSPLETLLHHLGEGLLAFLYTQQPRSKRLVTKTPWAKNLSYIYKLFPHAQVLILVRDGRSVVESGVRSFYWDYRSAMRQWAARAGEIRDFAQANQQRSDQFLIVHYEDLYARPVAELTRILTFLALDAERYDFAAAVDAPILGSSDLRREDQNAEMHWIPLEKKGDFAPLARWQEWDDVTHQVFNQIAGKEMRHFGYTLYGPFSDSDVEQASPTVGSLDDMENDDSRDGVGNSPEQIVEQLLKSYQRQKTDLVETRAYPERSVYPPWAAGPPT